MQASEWPDRQLPNGEFVCSWHGFVRCDLCLMEAMEDNAFPRGKFLTPEGRTSGRRMARGLQAGGLQKNYLSGEEFPVRGDRSRVLRLFESQTVASLVKAQKFVPPAENDTPESLFEAAIPAASAVPFPRYIRRSDPEEVLIFTSGTCSNKGQEKPTAGCGIHYKPTTKGAGFRLESHGPTGLDSLQNSNRAELRAVVAALHFRLWYGEGFTRVIIATDSEYVVRGITEHTETWISRGWKTSSKTAVKNRDLWQLLLTQIEDYLSLGTTILFWHIPKALNQKAGIMAVEGSQKAAVSTFTKMTGVVC